MSLKKACSQIRFELGQIEQLLDTYKDLLAECRDREPDLIKMTAVASVLHSFYNGIESIFLSIAKEADGVVPSGVHWHRDLLVWMAQGNEKRTPVISSDLKEMLATYLGFRHFYRHSYSFHLEQAELKRLIEPITAVWDQFKREIQSFLSSLGHECAGDKL